MGWSWAEIDVLGRDVQAIRTSWNRKEHWWLQNLLSQRHILITRLEAKFPIAPYLTFRKWELSKSKNACGRSEWRWGPGAKAYTRPSWTPPLGRDMVPSKEREGTHALGGRGPEESEQHRMRGQVGEAKSGGQNFWSRIRASGSGIAHLRGLLQMQVLGSISDSRNQHLWTRNLAPALWASAPGDCFMHGTCMVPIKAFRILS